MNPKRVGLELTALHSSLRSRGEGRVAQGYLEELSRRKEIELLPFVYENIPKLESTNGTSHTRDLWDRWLLAWQYQFGRPDVIQIIDPLRVPPFHPAPVVTVVHDVLPYLFRERYQSGVVERYLYWREKRQIRRSDAIITPARHTAQDLKVRFDLSPDRIHTIPHGINHNRFYPRPDEEIQTVLDSFDIQLPYFLVVSDLTGPALESGLEEVIELWDPDALSGVSLVVSGKTGTDLSPMQTLWPGEPEHLVFTGFVNDDQLAALYTGARLLIFASRYDGFGFPVLEAMACGTRPVLRDAGPMKEIAGDPAIMIPEDRFEEELLDVLTSDLDTESQTEACREQANKYRWENTIDQVMEVYQSLGADVTA